MTHPSDLVQWYEAGLPAHERKHRGHFSTPPLLVEQILDACGYSSDRDLSHTRVLDPACGSGNFLTAATRRLLQAGKDKGISSQALVKSVQQNIWGFDPDPISCFLAEMQLHSTIQAYQPTNRHCDLHIHQADGLAFPWEEDTRFDLFLANPPYLAAKNNDLSGYRSTHQRGQADSYLLFLSLALQIVRPHGWLALVLPDPVLARSNATRERQRLLAETTIHHLWHLSDVFHAYVGAVVIIAQKCPPPGQHFISWQREKWVDQPKSIHHRHHTTTNQPAISAMARIQEQLENKQPHLVAQKLLSHQPQSELRYLLSTHQGTFIERLCHHLHQPHIQQPSLAYLGDFFIIRRGEELGKDSPTLRNIPSPAHETHWYPVLRGGIDIRPYSIPRAESWIAQENIVKPLARYLSPKLLLVKSAGDLRATLDLQGHIVLQTLYTISIKPQRSNAEPLFSVEEELYFLMALLNSNLLQEYVYIMYTAYKWVQPQIEQHVLSHLPIPGYTTRAEKAAIIDRAKKLMHACSETTTVVKWKAQAHELYEEQERAIYHLYATALQERHTTASPRESIDKGVTFYG